MKVRYNIIPALLFYLLGAAGIFIYGIGELHPDLLLSPDRRLLLLTEICVCVYIAGRSLCKKPGVDKHKIMHRTFLFMFLLYIILLFTLTLFDPNFGRTGTVSFLFSDRELMMEYLESSVNLSPFETIERYIKALETQKLNLSVIVTNLLGNFTALMPMALFLPMLFRRCRNFLWFTGTVTLTVVLIEVLQLLFMTGSCDVDDLILNVIGACMAYLILNIPPIKKFLRAITLQEQ